MKITSHQILGAALVLGGSACSGTSADRAGEVGAIELAVTNAPADAVCLKATIAGTRTAARSFDLTPGVSTKYLIGGLPTGIVSVSGQAYAIACASVAPDSVPGFVTEASVSVRVDPADVAKVVLRLARNGRLSIDVDFEASTQPYLVPAVSGVLTKALLTAGDSVNLKPDGTAPYRMVGIPDGLGAFDNGDGTFTLLVNHELDGNGVERAHGAKGAFVSRWIVRKADLTVLHGEDLIQQVVLWDPIATVYKAPAKGVSFRRFCSADLAAPGAFFDPVSGLGYNGRLYLNGEEAGAEGRAVAHAMDGMSYELPRLGKMSFENALASPNPGAKTIVALDDDGGPAQVYFYVGTKTFAGSPVERAGLTNGSLYGLKITGFPVEAPLTGIPSGTNFTLAGFGNVENMTGAALDAASVAAGVTSFQRAEDGSWDPMNSNDYYFVTTASFTGASRLWRARFIDINDPTLGGKLDMLLDGTEGHKMLDNITVDKKGHVYCQEDVGNQDHIGKVWRYDIAGDTLTMIMQHNPVYFAPGAPQFLTRDEESSGIIDASDILGPGWLLTDVQAHVGTDAELVEGGQLLSVFDPAGK